MALSKRLDTVLRLAPPCETAADIGTDHGLTAAALIERGLCGHVIATDLREGPLSAARKLVTERGLNGKIELRLGDGLAPLKPGEAELIILTGMGGALMQRILTEGAKVARAAKQLILSPQSELPEFRRFLEENGYGILTERAVEEDGKFYFILSVKPAFPLPLTEAERELGRNIAEENFPEYERYLNKEEKKLNSILRNIAEKSAGNEKRILAIRNKLQLIGTVKRAIFEKGRKTMGIKLGFGLMRLPRLADGSIDVEQGKQMVDRFLAGGGTYFDTAFVYEGSEEATRKMLVERIPRESYTLATKINARAAGSAEAARAQFETSLERTGAGYFDYYLLHAMGSGNIDLYRDYGLWEFAAEKKKEGLIRHLGFSFHDTPELLDQILTEHPEAEFLQLQINYADWENPDVQSRACYEVARKHGKPVVIMEPVKGGTLASLPEEAEAVFKGIRPELSVASWGIRFAASLDGVLAVLSGMSTLEQMEDNMSFMENFEPLSEEERAAVGKAVEILASQRQIPCTACKYCVEGCPMGIKIPDLFSVYNFFLRFRNLETAKKRYEWRQKETGKASDCIKCGACEGSCPQHLPIRDLLEEIAGVME